MNKSIDVTLSHISLPDSENLQKRQESEDIHNLPLDDLITYIEGSKKKIKKQKLKLSPNSVSPVFEDFPELDKEVDEFRQRIDVPFSSERSRVIFSEEFLDILKSNLRNIQYS